jgi:hypothetical protein
VTPFAHREPRRSTVVRRRLSLWCAPTSHVNGKLDEDGHDFAGVSIFDADGKSPTGSLAVLTYPCGAQILGRPRDLALHLRS